MRVTGTGPEEAVVPSWPGEELIVLVAILCHRIMLEECR